MLFGLIGTTLGGVCGAFLDIKSDKIISFILQFAAGLMLAVICFDLIPEGLKIINTVKLVFGIILGVFVMIFCNDIVGKKLSKNNSSNLLKLGIVIGAVLQFGSGFEASQKLGIALAIAICIHDFPERNCYGCPFKTRGI